MELEPTLPTLQQKKSQELFLSQELSGSFMFGFVRGFPECFPFVLTHNEILVGFRKSPEGRPWSVHFILEHSSEMKPVETEIMNLSPG